MFKGSSRPGSPANLLSFLSTPGKGDVYDDSLELPDGADLQQENAVLKRRVAALESTLSRVRGERADLERVKRVMKRNSKLRRRLGGGAVLLYMLYLAQYNLSFLGLYNMARGRPYDCAVRPYGGLILEGGGVKGIAYGGAAAALESYGLLKGRRHIASFAGTSAGAMMGALLAARVPARNVTEYLLEFPFEKLMDGSHALANVGRLQRRLGWFKGDEIEARMRQLLAGSGVGANATLRELEDARRTTLRLSVTDLTAGRHAWLDGRTAPNISVAAAVRASSAVPFVYPPVRIGKRLFVDGGLVRNIPWDAFGLFGLADSRKRLGWLGSLPHRRRAVLALSLRGTETSFAEGLEDGVFADDEEDEPPEPKRRGFFGVPLLNLGGDDPDERERRKALNRQGFAGLWAFGNKLVELVTFGADSPNAIPPDGPALDVVKIDNLDIQAAEFNLNARARAHLVASGYVAVAKHLEACGHGAAPPPPRWLVDVLANYSGGPDLAPSLSLDRGVLRPGAFGPREAVEPTKTEL